MGPFPADNILGAPAGSSTLAVDAGIYLLLEPLSEGQHTIHFTANLDWAPFCVGDCIDTTYEITVERSWEKYEQTQNGSEKKTGSDKVFTEKRGAIFRLRIGHDDYLNMSFGKSCRLFRVS